MAIAIPHFKSRYELTDLFPDCMLPNCPDIIPSGKPHQHILPKQQMILDSITKYLYCQGGVGSAKSVAFAAKCVMLSIDIPNNEGVVCRKNFKDLYKSSWRDIKVCLRRLVDRGIIPEPQYSAKTQGDYSCITLHNGSILYAIQGKNWSDALGPSYGWFWVDDCMECYAELFVGDDNSAGLISRLRLPHVHYDPTTYDAETREHGSMHGMVSTNPPPIGHWSHKLFGNTPGIHDLGEDKVQWLQTASHDNPFTGASYSKGLIAIQKKLGKDSDVIRRVVFGDSIPAYGGVKVFPEFVHAKHVASLKYNSKLPLICGWDFGFLSPAITFSNLFKCKYGTNHYVTLSELADLFSVNVHTLHREYEKHINALYKDCCLIVNAGDRAGWRNSSSNRDNRGDMKILKDEYKLPFKWRHIDLSKSLEYMRGLLQAKCQCGLETILISTKCPVLIGALEGGYKYSKSREGKISDKPYEDRYFADIACAWRYGAENYVKWGLAGEEKAAVKQANAGGFIRGRHHEPWAWMDLSDREMGAILTR